MTRNVSFSVQWYYIWYCELPLFPDSNSLSTFPRPWRLWPWQFHPALVSLRIAQVKYENAALFLASTLKLWVFVLVWTEHINDDFLDQVFLKHKSSDCWVFKFLQSSVNGKHLMRFRVKPAFPNSSGVVWTELYFVIPFCGCLLCPCMSAMCIHQCCNSPCNWIQTCPACSLGLLLQRATALDPNQPESQQINIDKQCKTIFSWVS